MQLKKRHPLSKKDRKKLSRKIVEVLPGKNYLNTDDCDLLEVGELLEYTVYLCDDTCFLVETDSLVIPCLKYLVNISRKSEVNDILVDRGASKAVMRGADLMAPGVVSVITDFEAGDIVVIGDKDTNTPVGVGKALLGSDDLKRIVAEKGKGKVVQVLHHVGDKLWKLT